MPILSRTRARTATAVAVALVTAAGLALVAAQPPSTSGDSPSARERAWRANNVGVAYLEQFNYARAADEFRRALEIDGTLTAARVNLAIASFYVPDLAAARREAEAVSQRAAAPPHADFLLGLIARAENREDDAVAAFRRVLAADPDDVGALVNLGQLLLQQRAYAEAVPAFARAVDLEPYNVSALYNLAVAHTRAGDRAAGAAITKRFQTLRESGYGTTYSNTYLEQGRYAEAILSTGAEADLVERAAPPLRYTAAPLPPVAEARDAVMGVHAADLDGDGRSDLVLATGDRLRLRLQPSDGLGTAGPATTVPVEGLGARGVVVADLGNDGKPDLVAHGRAGLRLLRQTDSGFEDVTAAAGVRSVIDVHAVSLVDLDHDGDLDIVAGGDTAAGDPAPLEAWRNDGDGTFTDLSATIFAGQPPQRVRQVVATDFDLRRDIDLVVRTEGGDVTLWRNMRDGTFADATAATGLDAAPPASTIAIADVDKNGFPDLYLAGRDGASAIAAGQANNRFRVATVESLPRQTTAALFLDADADGLLDLVTAGPSGVAVTRNVGGGWQPLPAATALETTATGLAALDTQGDGRLDLVALHGGDVALLVPTGVSHATVVVGLAGQVSNRSGVGAKVEMRAGSLWQKLETAASSPSAVPADLVFGLGTRRSVDVVRVLWPAGIVQAEIQRDEAMRPTTTDDAAVRRVEVVELDRKPSSCPYLFTWNGDHFEFVTDFLGGGEMGYQLAPGVFNTPDPEEYVRIRGDQLVPRDGVLELRVTNELEETLFLDAFSLLAVDHPATLEVHPHEGLFAPPFPAFELFAAGRVRPVATALDHRGRDVGKALARVDRRYVDNLPLLPIRGYAEPHALTLDLGDAPAAGTLLLLTGWTDYAFSSDNIAASQAGYVLQPPSLQVRDAHGAWQTVVDEVGIPVGRPQTVVVDLDGRFLSDSREVRLLTTMRVYWDAAAVAARADDRPLVQTRLAPRTATLGWRGFSAIASDGEPLTFDYARVSPTSPWKQMPGRYTREGDVLPLLDAVDDRFVVARPGDEVVLRFDAAALPPLPTGWARTYLLHSDGFSKEMDINSASPDHAWPLPGHGDTPTASRATESGDRRDPLAVTEPAWVTAYNTRVVGRQVPRLGGVAP